MSSLKIKGQGTGAWAYTVEAIKALQCWDWSTQYGCWRDQWCGRHGQYHPCTKPILDEGLSLCAEHAEELRLEPDDLDPSQGTESRP